MATSLERESAQIYQFPIKARTAVGYRGEAMPISRLAARQIASASFGDGWYHDDAIEEARRSDEH